MGLFFRSGSLSASDAEDETKRTASTPTAAQPSNRYSESPLSRPLITVYILYFSLICIHTAISCCSTDCPVLTPLYEAKLEMSTEACVGNEAAANADEDDDDMPKKSYFQIKVSGL